METKNTKSIESVQAAWTAWDNAERAFAEDTYSDRRGELRAAAAEARRQWDARCQEFKSLIDGAAERGEIDARRHMELRHGDHSRGVVKW